MVRNDDSPATSPQDRSDPAFLVPAGLLEGSGDLADGLSAELAAERLRELLTPAALWVSQPLAPEDLARPGSERLGRVPRWRSPSAELTDETVRAVRAAWASVCPPPPPTWGHPVLRVQVSCFEDARRLQALDRIGEYLLVPTLDGPDAFRFCWRWPLRVGIALGPRNAEWSNQLAHSQYKRLFDARPAVSGDPEPFDLLLVDPESPSVPTEAGCVIVVGDTRSAEELLEWGHSEFDVGILATVPTSDVGWFDFVLAEMAHDQPLDVALRVVIPPSLIAANATLLNWTAVRQWALEVEEDLRRRESKVPHLVSVNFAKPPDGGGGGGPQTPTDDLHRLVLNEPFHAESHGASRIANVIRTLDSAGVEQRALIGRLAQLATFLAAVVIGIDQIGIDVSFVTTIIAVVLGVVLAGFSLAFGLGARQLVANLIAADTLRRSFRIGHRARIDGVEGEILELTSTSVVIATAEGRAIVPASRFAAETAVILMPGPDRA